jgi:hypothetical protein
MIATTSSALEPAPLPAAPRTPCPRCGDCNWSRFGTRWLCHACWRTGTNVTPDDSRGGGDAMLYATPQRPLRSPLAASRTWDEDLASPRPVARKPYPFEVEVAVAEEAAAAEARRALRDRRPEHSPCCRAHVHWDHVGGGTWRCMMCGHGFAVPAPQRCRGGGRGPRGARAGPRRRARARGTSACAARSPPIGAATAASSARSSSPGASSSSTARSRRATRSPPRPASGRRTG